jgi:hypothetical protein
MREYKEPFYTKEDGIYYWHFGFEKLCMGEEVAIGFAVMDDGGTVLHKQGSKEKVEAWADKYRKKLIAGGLADIANSLVVISSCEFNTEDLDKFINSTGYITTWLKRHRVSLNIEREDGTFWTMNYGEKTGC